MASCVSPLTKGRYRSRRAGDNDDEAGTEEVLMASSLATCVGREGGVGEMGRGGCERQNQR